MKFKYLILGLLLLFSCSLIFSQNKKHKNPVYSVGDIITVGNKLHFSIEKAGQWNSKSEFIKPEFGKMFYSVLIYMKNIGDTPLSYNLFNCSIKDSEGYEYISTYGGPEPNFSSGQLEPDDIIRGYLNFEIPYNTSGLKFIYTFSMWSENKIIVHLTN